ncbi:2'-5' RNA ligase family protein [Jannaschia sp. W003]|uniref:2'-5' RNA ligase family protein n=1 Tax=Jannaschia sp. W003 TaxID=2867012 RepID=UPI0021A269BE|nr:2'-5' RNA ligase family protein [Jannaschia sp. W003]UWQ22464.1 2'-5' RNA ligase family protein [Jannaschia sp. W003]
MDPLIVTLEVDPASDARFQAARRRWFPLHRQQVPAHVTLFHKLPGEDVVAVAGRLEDVAAAHAPLPFRVTAVMPLGRAGAAFRLEVPGLRAVRSQIARGFELAPQDRGGGRPHVTIQNKVAPAVAAAVLQRLQAGFAPWEGTGTGLALWRYRGGPWEAAGAWRFAGAPDG